MVEAAAAGRPVVLCGFMGVGKSSVGRRVARALEREFVDSDTLIERRSGRSIAEIFAIEGEASFRSLEAAVVAECVRRRPPVVLAIGGGALGAPKTRALLLEESLLVHLDQPFSAIAGALPALRRGRPLLAEKSDEEVRALYDARRPLYAIAPVQVHVERRGLNAAAEAVLEAIAAGGSLHGGGESHLIGSLSPWPHPPPGRSATPTPMSG